MRFRPYKGRKLTFMKGSRFSGGPDISQFHSYSINKQTIKVCLGGQAGKVYNDLIMHLEGDKHRYISGYSAESKRKRNDPILRLIDESNN